MVVLYYVPYGDTVYLIAIITSMQRLYLLSGHLCGSTLLRFIVFGLSILVLQYYSSTRTVFYLFEY